MHTFPRAFVRHGLSLVGTAIATAMAALFAVPALLDLSGYLTNPYLGLLLFVAIPVARTARLLAGAQDVYARNVFPAMRVTWGTYPNNIGHMDAQGCFRCHDDGHAAHDGGVISQDRETCHTAPE